MTRLNPTTAFRLALVCLLSSTALTPGPGVAQQSASAASPWFPQETIFAPLIAASREVQFRGSFVLANRSLEPGFEGTNIEAEVAIGHAVPVYLLDDGPSPVILGFEFAMYSRFFMEEATRDLIHIGFRVGIPISFRTGPWEGRVSLRHISSHLGDDYLARFSIDVNEQTSKEGVEALLARRFLDYLRLYAGGEANFHTNDRMSKAAARWGIEFDRRPGPEVQGDALWPFVAGDFELPTLSGRVGGTLTGGIGFRVSGREFRAEARAHFGPTAMAQFREADENFFGLGFRVEL